MKLLEQYAEYENHIRDGNLGKTAEIWMSFIDNSRLLQMLIYSVKTNNYELFHKCHSNMAILFSAYDG